MQKNPIYQFKNENSMGIDTVPNETVIMIEDYLGTGVKTVLKTGHAGMTIASTVGHFITATANWIEICDSSAPVALEPVAIAMFENTTEEIIDTAGSIILMGSNSIPHADFTHVAGVILINKDMLIEININANFTQGNNRSENIAYARRNGLIIESSYSRGYIRGNGEVDSTSCYGHALIHVFAGDIIDLFSQSLTTDSTSIIGQCSIMVSNAEGLKGDDGPAGPAGGTLIPGGTTGQHLIKLSNTDHDVGWAEQGVMSTTTGNETRVSTMISMTKANYDAIAVKQLDRLYVING